MSKVYDIGVLPGDGIGDEVVREALKVLDAIEPVYGFRTRREVLPYGAEHFLKTGETMRLVNDHDPKPLYYQLMAERAGQAGWEYLEDGPEVWQVRITRLGGE